MFDWLNVNFFIQYMKDINCKYFFYLYSELIVCEDKIVDVENCNEIGIWQFFDLDVLKVCQDLEKFCLFILYDKVFNILYSNKFCKICNFYYVFLNKILIVECDSYWMLDLNIIDICYLLLDVYVCFQYKNIVCEICNGDLGCEFEYSKVKKIEYEYVFFDSSLYRLMFVLFFFDLI